MVQDSDRWCKMAMVVLVIEMCVVVMVRVAWWRGGVVVWWCGGVVTSCDRGLSSWRMCRGCGLSTSTSTNAYWMRRN